MNIPPVLTAEAVLKPKAGGISLLDPTVEVTDDNRRKFCADPANIKRAVDELKKAGFSVTSIGKISIGITGSTALFQQQFKVTIIADDDGCTTAENSTRPGFIQSKGFLENELEGIVLTQANEQYNIYYGSDPPPMDLTKICRYAPADIPTLLGFSSIDQFNAVKVSLNKTFTRSKHLIVVNVVDSGFYDHSYFEKYKDLYVSVRYDKIAFEKYATDIDNLERFLIDLEEIVRTSPTDDITSNELYRKVKSLNPKRHSLALLNDIEGIRTKTALKKFIQTYPLFNELEKKAKEITVFRDQKDEQFGHGTRIVASIFPILSLLDPSQVEIRVHRETPGSNQNDFFNRFDNTPELKIRKNEIHIINCSYGSAQKLQDNDPRKELVRKNIALAAKKAIVIFSSGNRVDDGVKFKNFEPQLPDIISVGGAYRVGNDVVGSNFAHGYQVLPNKNKIIPDICGLCGPFTDDDFDGGAVWLPYYDYTSQKEGWLSVGGTSFAAPQVAATCAILKMMKPDLDLIGLKSILYNQCDRITKGTFFSPVLAETADATRRGLVNIRESMIAVGELLKTKQQ
jgi:hypothetical protein